VNRTRLPLVTATLTAVATAFLASACAAGGNAATLQVKPDHAAGQTGSMLAQNVVVVVDPATGAAQLTGTIINSGTDADQLTAVNINGTPVALSYPLSIGSKSALNLGADKGVKLVLPAAKGAKPVVQAGANSDVNLTFSANGALKLAAAVESNTGVYAAYQPSIAAKS